MFKLQADTDNSRPVLLYEYSIHVVGNIICTIKRSVPNWYTADQNDSLIIGIYKIFYISSFSSQIE